MKYKDINGNYLKLLTIFIVTTSKGMSDNNEQKYIIADSIKDAMKKIEPYLELNEDITSVTKAHHLNIYTEPMTLTDYVKQLESAAKEVCKIMRPWYSQGENKDMPEPMVVVETLQQLANVIGRREQRG